MTTSQNELLAKSVIIRGERADKPLEAIPAPNPNQTNRIIGYLPNGQKVVVAQRPGRGGVEFTKLVGGKVLAVAADGFSPVYEKGADKKPTTVQKTENGLPLFSSSGFYLLSSKAYPALDVFSALVKIADKGEIIDMVSPQQLETRQRRRLTEFDQYRTLLGEWVALLGYEHNRCAQYDGIVNKRREIALRRASEDAAMQGEEFTGPAYAQLEVSPKDGNPFLYVVWRAGEAPLQDAMVLRQCDREENGHLVTDFFGPEEAVKEFTRSAAGKAIAAALKAGTPVSIAFVQGHRLRGSVAFRRKVENLVERPSSFGDGVFIQGALQGWTQALVALLQSAHPKFPLADYSAHYYVATCHQQAIRMKKLPTGSWQPEALLFDLARKLTEPVRAKEAVAA